ncbi:ATP-binding protein [Ramlibacter sp. WS9]|uniref:ATP-binding protein n=1 Tax=Ramlibacter sp. WS9 TaxID=1882741 RepID=UPI0013052095|nr:ATP-binding protein [Ramlibacter sp. WS9]
MTSDLKVPFQLQGGQRIEDTPVHEALREALVNTLIHADFTGRVSVLVVKQADMFSFRNPGLMRLPLEMAVAGGNSDCRNRCMQTMFQQVGYGDHAGSGVPKIYRNWAGQHWRLPVLRQRAEPEQTLLELRMTSLLPPDSVAALEAQLGARFAGLAELERLALVTAATEGTLNHTRLREISTDHPSDITKMLARLVKDGMLASEGTGRGMVYRLPKQRASQYTDFAEGDAALLTPEQAGLTPEQAGLTPEQAGLTPELDAPTVTVVSDLSQLSAQELARLQRLAEPVSGRQRVQPEIVKQTVIALCREHYLGLRVLAELLARRDHDGADLRKRILNPLVKDGLLMRAYPSPNDPRQAYQSTPDGSSPKP